MKMLKLLFVLASLSGFAAAAEAECLQSSALVDSEKPNIIDTQDRAICVEGGFLKVINNKTNRVEFNDRIINGPADEFVRGIVTEHYTVIINRSEVRAEDGNSGNVLIMARGSSKAYVLK